MITCKQRQVRKHTRCMYYRTKTDEKSSFLGSARSARLRRRIVATPRSSPALAPTCSVSLPSGQLEVAGHACLVSQGPFGHEYEMLKYRWASWAGSRAKWSSSVKRPFGQGIWRGRGAVMF